jgi:hypothetical protein
MKVKIENGRRGEYIVKGVDEKGKEYFVIGGDLCSGEIIEIEKYQNHEILWINSKINYPDVKIFSNHFDKDGLVDFNKLKEVIRYSKPNRRIYQLEGYWVFIEGRIQRQVEFLYANGLIKDSRVKISKSWIFHSARAPVYGINYSKLLKKVIEKGEPISSWFICEKEKDFNGGAYADLFIIGNYNEKDLQIQLWQIIGEGAEVLFAHGLIDKETMKFNHFDLASHFIDPMIIPNFLSTKQRMELTAKKKWIRVDGEINESQVLDMIKMFFPLDHLVDEFMENPVNNKSSA